MNAECTRTKLRFQGLDGRDVVGRFDGGEITSDGGGVLLREVEHRTRILGRLSECFTDHRDPDRIEHSVEALIKQRVLGLCLGYEDLNDHDELYRDRLLALLCDRDDLTGEFRRVESDRGKPLAGKSTLNRLELTPVEGPKPEYKKIVADPAGMDELLVEVFLEAHAKAPEELILDLDATDDPLHGKQEGRFFHGYYKRYCYLPLYIFCGEHLLCARLRSSDRGAAHGVVPELKGIVRRLREAWPQVRITVCGDSDFSKDELMLWCETEGVDYVFGLAQNPRLKQPIATAMEAVRQRRQASGKAEREFQELRYQTLDTWTRERRVVAKVEHLPRGENPRFIVTSVPVQECAGRRLYEVVYCGRGEMENRIKEQQLGLFADRTSSRKLQANQLRLYFSSFAYVMLQRLRQWGLAATELAFAQCWTIRRKVLKIGAQVRVTSRKVWLSFSESYPYAALLRRVLARLQAFPLRC